jgi:hypothetical protein
VGWHHIIWLLDSAPAKIGRARLQWDVHKALGRLYQALGRDELARKHPDTFKNIVRQISENLQQAEMRSGLPG